MTDFLMTLRTVASLAVVLALLGGFIWALKRGSIKLSGFAPKGIIAIETATALGDRRQLAIVTVENRRVLVGMTPTSISFIAELGQRADATGAAR